MLSFAVTVNKYTNWLKFRLQSADPLFIREVKWVICNVLLLPLLSWKFSHTHFVCVDIRNKQISPIRWRFQHLTIMPAAQHASPSATAAPYNNRLQYGLVSCTTACTIARNRVQVYELWQEILYKCMYYGKNRVKEYALWQKIVYCCMYYCKKSCRSVCTIVRNCVHKYVPWQEIVWKCR